MCNVSSAAAPYVRTLKALTRNLLTYLHTYLHVEIDLRHVCTLQHVLSLTCLQLVSDLLKNVEILIGRLVSSMFKAT